MLTIPSFDFSFANLDGVSDLFANELGVTPDFSSNTPVEYSWNSLNRLLNFFQELPKSPPIIVASPEESRRQRDKWKTPRTPPIVPKPDIVEVMPPGYDPSDSSGRKAKEAEGQPDPEIDPAKNPQLGKIIEAVKQQTAGGQLTDFLKGSSILLVGLIVLILLVLLFKR